MPVTLVKKNHEPCPLPIVPFDYLCWHKNHALQHVTHKGNAAIKNANTQILCEKMKSEKKNMGPQEQD